MSIDHRTPGRRYPGARTGLSDSPTPPAPSTVVTASPLRPTAGPGAPVLARTGWADIVAVGWDLPGMDLEGECLAGADLTGAVLESAHLAGADLKGARLVKAVLREADLSNADLTGAVLRDACLCGADLWGRISPVPICAECAWRERW